MKDDLRSLTAIVFLFLNVRMSVRTGGNGADLKRVCFEKARQDHHHRVRHLLWHLRVAVDTQVDVRVDDVAR